MCMIIQLQPNITFNEDMSCLHAKHHINAIYVVLWNRVYVFHIWHFYWNKDHVVWDWYGMIYTSNIKCIMWSCKDSRAHADLVWKCRDMSVAEICTLYYAAAHPVEFWMWDTHARQWPMYWYDLSLYPNTPETVRGCWQKIRILLTWHWRSRITPIQSLQR